MRPLPGARPRLRAARRRFRRLAQDGITIDGIHYGSIEARLEREQGANLWLVFAIREGKNREVKNVLGHLGLAVNRLIRVSFGPFQLGDLGGGRDRGGEDQDVLREQLGERVAALARAPIFRPPIAGATPTRTRSRPAQARRWVDAQRGKRGPRKHDARSGAGGRRWPGPQRSASRRRARSASPSASVASSGPGRRPVRRGGAAAADAHHRRRTASADARKQRRDRTAIRPTADRLRESLFNILVQHAYGDPVTDARVLDLFAGTGALGLEALSRGAAFALFVDDGAEARALMRENVAALGLGGTSRIFRRDATKLGPVHPLEPFSLVFLDPPYRQGLAERALVSAQAGGWLTPDALIVVEEAADAAFAAPEGYADLERRRYDDTEFVLLRGDR